MSLFKAIKLPIDQTKAFSKLIVDYAQNQADLKELYGLRPDVTSFEPQIKAKAKFDAEHRYTLVKSLSKQYGRLKNVQVSSELVEENVLFLEHANTFTVTTGHQLNLFTGPLYFWYKIVHVINLAKALKEAYPEHHFVPVYWMATEDHDFDEINHIQLYGGTPRWDRPSGGAVGRLNLEGMDQVLEDLSSVMGPSKNADYLRDLFQRAYRGQANLADATRYMVHEFFADQGLVIVDGDDAELKSIFYPAAGRELKERVFANSSRKAIETLEAKYHVQVNPRPVNLFYLEETDRRRIDTENGSEWNVVDADRVFPEKELDAELENHPQRFSPNAIMRPLYQEMILPNLAYIGGGAEVAYWMELKDVFEAYEVPFPILFLRNSGLIVGKKENRKREKLQIDWTQLFEKLDVLVNKEVSEKSNEELDLRDYRLQLEAMFSEMEKIASRTDQTFTGAVNAQRAKQLKGLENLEKRLLKAEKRKHHELVERISNLKNELFPAGKLQERYDNFIPYFEEYGAEFKQALLNHLDPFTFDFHVLYIND